jgi:hypothetical protein
MLCICARDLLETLNGFDRHADSLLGKCEGLSIVVIVEGCVISRLQICLQIDRNTAIMVHEAELDGRSNGAEVNVVVGLWRQRGRGIVITCSP